MSYVHMIASKQKFAELTAKFDRAHGTQTYVANITLKEIWDHFVAKNDFRKRWLVQTTQEFTDKIIEMRANQIFAQKDVVYTNDPEYDFKIHGHYNSMYMLRNEIRNKKGLICPISLSKNKEGDFIIHPGTTRMLFADVYHEKIPVVITNYHSEKIEHPLISQNMNDIHFNFAKTPVFLIQFYHNTIPIYDGVHRNFKPYAVKELISLHTKDPNFTKSNTLDKPRKFVISKDRQQIYIDDELMFKKTDGTWRIIIE